MGSRIFLTLCAIALGFLLGICVPAGEWFGLYAFDELAFATKALIYILAVILSIVWFVVFFRQPD